MWDNFKENLKNFFSSRLLPIAVVYLLLFGILINRLFDLQILNGKKYEKQTESKSTKTKVLKATRGNIYDCKGRLLAYNKLSYNVTYADTDSVTNLSSEQKNEIILRLLHILNVNHTDLAVERFIDIDKNGKLYFTQSGNSLLRFKAEAFSEENGVKGLMENSKEKIAERNATAQQIFDFLCYDTTSQNSPKFDISKKYDKKTALDILTIRYAVYMNRFQKYQDVIIAQNVNEKVVAAVKENSGELSGFDISEDTKRVYNKSKYFAHLLGYTGAITSEKLAKIKEKDPDTDYDSSDQIGLSGLESTYEKYLRGKKGSEQLIINESTSRVTDVTDVKEPKVGNDLYLTIDADLQEKCYHILETHIAGILLTKISSNDNAGSRGHSSSDIRIPISDVYNALFYNNLIDITHFSSKNASSLEKSMLSQYYVAKKELLAKVNGYLAPDSTKTKKDLSDNMQEMVYYFYTLLKNNNIVLVNKVDTSDATYKAFTEGKISQSKFLQYAISKEWIDLKALKIKKGYYSTEEIYQKLVKYGLNLLKNDVKFQKLVYKYLVYQHQISGSTCCLLMMDQKRVKYTKDEYQKVSCGMMSAYTFIKNKIKDLEITPGQLGLEPCSGSMVMTDTKTGQVRAMVSYPSYDNNKLANKVDAEYYNKYLSQCSSSPLLNRPTQQKLAPGSTFKMLSSIAGLEEGVITPNTHIYDKVVFTQIGPPSPKCWSTVSHGDLTVPTALEDSCNYFYYTVGLLLSGGSNHHGGVANKNLGLSRLKKYANLVGLTSKSGVEINEVKPEFASIDPVRAAIGQDTNAYTPAQLSRYVTTIANNGTCYNLTLVDKITTPKGKIIKKNKAKVKHKLHFADSTWNAVHSGMKLVVYGKDSHVKGFYQGLKQQVAGKTGTAQQSVKHANHAYFVSYAPYNNPEISVTCCIPNGYTSTYAGETVSDVYKYYYSKSKNKEKKVFKVKLPSTSVTVHD